MLELLDSSTTKEPAAKQLRDEAQHGWRFECYQGLDRFLFYGELIGLDVLAVVKKRVGRKESAQ